MNRISTSIAALVLLWAVMSACVLPAEAKGPTIRFTKHRLDDRFVIQGNLDPCTLLAPPEVVRAGARRVLEEARGLPGHVFNLGHGILPDTPLEQVEALVETVRASGNR